MLITPNTKVADLTVAQLLECIDEHLNERAGEAKRIYGIEGLMEFLGCSRRTAQRLRSSGTIDKATIQSGRTLVFDERQLRKVLQLK